jgi:cytochrome c oxidase subunit IV
MHVAWERTALKVVILGPPIALMVLILLMTYEADYTFMTRIDFFGEGAPRPEAHH